MIDSLHYINKTWQKWRSGASLDQLESQNDKVVNIIDSKTFQISDQLKLFIDQCNKIPVFNSEEMENWRRRVPEDVRQLVGIFLFARQYSKLQKSGFTVDQYIKGHASNLEEFKGYRDDAKERINWMKESLVNEAANLNLNEQLVAVLHDGRSIFSPRVMGDYDMGIVWKSGTPNITEFIEGFKKRNQPHNLRIDVASFSLFPNNRLMSKEFQLNGIPAPHILLYPYRVVYQNDMFDRETWNQAIGISIDSARDNSDEIIKYCTQLVAEPIQSSSIFIG